MKKRAICVFFWWRENFTRRSRKNGGRVQRRGTRLPVTALPGGQTPKTHDYKKKGQGGIGQGEKRNEFYPIPNRDTETASRRYFFISEGHRFAQDFQRDKLIFSNSRCVNLWKCESKRRS